MLETLETIGEWPPELKTETPWHLDYSAFQNNFH